MVPDYLLVELFAVFGVVNALAFLHVGAPFRRLLSGTEDAFWRTNVKSYREHVETRAYYMGNPWERSRLLWLGRFAHCHACLGFWVGGAYSWWSGAPVAFVVEFAFTSSAFCFVCWVILRRLGAEEL